MTLNNSLNQTDHPKLILKVNSPKAFSPTERAVTKTIIQNLTLKNYGDNVFNNVRLQIKNSYY